MKLTATMMLTVDGVYQGPGGPDEDRRGGFERGGWVAAHFDEETGRFVSTVFERADALLLGRRTWEIFEAYWPRHDEGEADPVSHGINVLPKYVPSTTLPGPWQRRAAPLAARARPRRRAQPRDPPGRSGRRASALPGARADARPDAGRIADHPIRGDAPDLSACRPRHLRDRRGVTPAARRGDSRTPVTSDRSRGVASRIDCARYAV
jgi:hypothetical protein